MYTGGLNPNFNDSYRALERNEVNSRIRNDTSVYERTAASYYAIANARNLGKPQVWSQNSVIFNRQPPSHVQLPSFLDEARKFRDSDMVNRAVMGKPTDNEPSTLNLHGWHEARGLPTQQDEKFMMDIRAVNKEQRIADLQGMRGVAGNPASQQQQLERVATANYTKSILQTLKEFFFTLEGYENGNADGKLPAPGTEPTPEQSSDMVALNTTLAKASAGLAQMRSKISFEEIRSLKKASDSIENPGFIASYSRDEDSRGGILNDLSPKLKSVKKFFPAWPTLMQSINEITKEKSNAFFTSRQREFGSNASSKVNTAQALGPTSGQPAGLQITQPAAPTPATAPTAAPTPAAPMPETSPTSAPTPATATAAPTPAVPTPATAPSAPAATPAKDKFIVNAADKATLVKGVTDSIQKAGIAAANGLLGSALKFIKRNASANGETVTSITIQDGIGFYQAQVPPVGEALTQNTADTAMKKIKEYYPDETVSWPKTDEPVPTVAAPVAQTEAAPTTIDATDQTSINRGSLAARATLAASLVAMGTSGLSGPSNSISDARNFGTLLGNAPLDATGYAPLAAPFGGTQSMVPGNGTLATQQEGWGEINLDSALNQNQIQSNQVDEGVTLTNEQENGMPDSGTIEGTRDPYTGDTKTATSENAGSSSLLQPEQNAADEHNVSGLSRLASTFGDFMGFLSSGMTGVARDFVDSGEDYEGSGRPRTRNHPSGHGFTHELESYYDQRVKSHVPIARESKGKFSLAKLATHGLKAGAILSMLGSNFQNDPNTGIKSVTTSDESMTKQAERPIIKGAIGLTQDASLYQAGELVAPGYGGPAFVLASKLPYALQQWNNLGKGELQQAVEAKIAAMKSVGAYAQQIAEAFATSVHRLATVTADASVPFAPMTTGYMSRQKQNRDNAIYGNVRKELGLPGIGSFFGASELDNEDKVVHDYTKKNTWGNYYSAQNAVRGAYAKHAPDFPEPVDYTGKLAGGPMAMLAAGAAASAIGYAASKYVTPEDRRRKDTVAKAVKRAQKKIGAHSSKAATEMAEDETMRNTGEESEGSGTENEDLAKTGSGKKHIYDHRAPHGDDGGIQPQGKLLPAEVYEQLLADIIYMVTTEFSKHEKDDDQDQWLDSIASRAVAKVLAKNQPSLLQNAEAADNIAQRPADPLDPILPTPPAEPVVGADLIKNGNDEFVPRTAPSASSGPTTLPSLSSSASASVPTSASAPAPAPAPTPAPAPVEDQSESPDFNYSGAGKPRSMWPQYVRHVYHEMKGSGHPNVTIAEASREASKRKKEGKMHGGSWMSSAKSALGKDSFLRKTALPYAAKGAAYAALAQPELAPIAGVLSGAQKASQMASMAGFGKKRLRGGNLEEPEWEGAYEEDKQVPSMQYTTFDPNNMPKAQTMTLSEGPAHLYMPGPKKYKFMGVTNSYFGAPVQQEWSEQAATMPWNKDYTPAQIRDMEEGRYGMKERDRMLQHTLHQRALAKGYSEGYTAADKQDLMKFAPEVASREFTGVRDDERRTAKVVERLVQVQARRDMAERKRSALTSAYKAVTAPGRVIQGVGQALQGNLGGVANIAGGVVDAVAGTAGVASSAIGAANQALFGYGKKGRKVSAWSQQVKEVYHELKKSNPNVTIAQAASEASKRRKAA